MPRVPVDTTIAGYKVTTTPLPFPSAQPLIPDVAEFISVAAGVLGPLLASGKLKGLESLKDPKTIELLAPVIGSVAKYFGAGRLEKLAPKIMATTVVVMADKTGELANYELGKGAEYAYVFDEAPHAYFPILFFAGRVTFERFFPGIGQAGGGTTAPAS